MKMLPEIRTPTRMGKPVLTINDKRIVLPAAVAPGQALTTEGPTTMKLWPGGMKPGTEIALPTSLRLKPGANKITFSQTGTTGFPGDVRVLLYRWWSMSL